MRGQLDQAGSIARGPVVLFVPVVPEAVVAFLACAMIGAISVPAFTGYGPEALAARLGDSEAVALVTADATTRRGKLVRAQRTPPTRPWHRYRACATRSSCVISAPTWRCEPGRDIYWDELDPGPEPVETVAVEANEPLTIIYTSGTTGRPKGIVHLTRAWRSRPPSTSGTASTCTTRTSSPGSRTWAGWSARS